MKIHKYFTLSLLVLATTFTLAESHGDHGDGEGIRVNINLASEEELLTIPGVGDSIAHEIEEYRPFVSLEHFEGELGKYLDEDALKALSAHITLGLANLNTATEEELAALPGMGDSIAHEVIEYRPFASVEHFRVELGKYIDEEAVGRIEAITTIGLVDVNSASEEELMAIPGVGDSIAHEIEEYRPFSSIQHFRTELGKYIDEEAIHAIELHLSLGQ